MVAIGETTRQALPGDRVTVGCSLQSVLLTDLQVSGIYLPTTRAGYRQMRTGLLTATHLKAFVSYRAL